MPLNLSAFPKCYLEQIASGQMSVFEWITMARQLDADGLEMYTGFFTSLEEGYLACVSEALQESSFAMPMLCCSPDLTAPSASKRKLEIERQAHMIAVARRLGGPGTVCRILTGQRYPDVSWEQGREWVLEAIDALLPVAREKEIVLGLENHYKDGFWNYPEFAQKMDRFLDIVNSVVDRTNFGVQYDPSNALVAGDDPIELLKEVAPRVVSMHASDRYLADGTTIESLRQTDGTLGYSPSLKHGVTGKGLNNYEAIFQILSENNYRGWVSIEDGMNGMQEMADSLAFLRAITDRYFP
jgi:sugar phosphate isomerase/epimerase